MALCPQHRFQVLTKRAKNLHKYTKQSGTKVNVAGEMFKLMGQKVPKAIPESMIPQWPLPNVWVGVSTEDQTTYNKRINGLMESVAAVKFLSCEPLLGPIDLQFEHMEQKPDWVIAGAESGPGARYMDEDWVRDIKNQCMEQGVAFFYKQKIADNGKKIETPELDGQKWTMYPGEEKPKVKLKNIIV